MNRFNVNEIVSRSSIVKFVSTSKTNVKGKSVHVEPSGEEKKRLQELELGNMKQLNNIMRQREKDPPVLDKEDLNKVWCYETIETIVIGDVDAFEKKNKKEKLCHGRLNVQSIGLPIQSFNVYFCSV